MRLPRYSFYLLLGFIVLNSLATYAANTAAQASQFFKNNLTPLFENYCYDCHGGGKKKGGLALDDYRGLTDILKNRKVWETLHENLRTHVMPPHEEAQPTQAERDLITGWIDRELFKIDPNNPDPGRVTIRRLNRAEYNNTIRDLIGVDFRPADDFPPDDSGYGFDNIGDALSLSPLLMEKYLAATEKFLDDAIPTEPVKSQVRRIPATLAEIGFNAIGDRGDGWVNLISLEDDDVAVELPVAAGDYLIRVQAFSTKDGGAVRGGGSAQPLVLSNPPPTRMSVMLNDTFIRDFELTTNEASPGVYEARVGVASGKQRFRAVARRARGGTNELIMLNGRIGAQQPGIIFVKWIEIEGPLPCATRRFPIKELEARGEGKAFNNDDWILNGPGEVASKINVARDSEYILRAQAYAQQAGDEPARMEFRVNGKPIAVFDVLAPANMKLLPRQRMFSPALLLAQPQVYEFKTKLPPGEHRIAAAFINDFSDPTNSNPNLRDRNLIIRSLEVANLSEPAPIPPMSEPMRHYFAGSAGIPAGELPKTQRRASSDASAPRVKARVILDQFAFRAWRRPVQPAELDRVMRLFELANAQGEKFETSVKLAMKAVLVSPNFLFRGEIQPDPDKPDAVHPIGEFALASRLSYFLWSSTPDDELLALAKRGELRKNLGTQVKRMLASARARSLTENFAGQWLEIRRLSTLQPDKELFPDFDAGLGVAMQKETELFFESILRADRSVLEFLTADYTFVNARLARHYGLAEVEGEEFRRVSLEGTHRRGVMTHGSVLMLTSNPTRTSPVKRGKWVLDNLLGTPPPPAPPDVPDLDDKGRQLTGTLREQMEQHRKNPSCAGCHARMDPIGFGLENFNAIGSWREKDGAAAVDSAGELVTGETFNGAVNLAEILAKNKQDDFLRCISEKMLTYALGRGLEYYDRPATERMVKALKDKSTFSQLILEVVNSVPFQMRRGEGDRFAQR